MSSVNNALLYEVLAETEHALSSHLEEYTVLAGLLLAQKAHMRYADDLAKQIHLEIKRIGEEHRDSMLRNVALPERRERTTVEYAEGETPPPSEGPSRSPSPNIKY